ncbi:hypothetical protein ACIRQY_06580 [Streptomyces sp. NPDC101490]|uniref:hypothetical protein n=1 Tax=Streptomyces sp. NPDC101490 TaxID=3366143 RepID=UPI003818A4BD
MGTRRTNIAAGTALVMAAPVALWGLMGQQDSEGFARSELTYSVEPFRALEGWDTGFGVVALLLTVVATVLLFRAGRAGTMAAHRWLVLLPLTGAGLFAAWGHRVLTAGEIGANIGAGLVLFGAPFALGLVVAALVLAVHQRPARPRT